MKESDHLVSSYPVRLRTRGRVITLGGSTRLTFSNQVSLKGPNSSSLSLCLQTSVQQRLKEVHFALHRKSLKLISEFPNNTFQLLVRYVYRAAKMEARRIRRRARPWNAFKVPWLGPFNETLIAKGQPCVHTVNNTHNNLHIMVKIELS